jgi:hypothetical protein
MTGSRRTPFSKKVPSTAITSFSGFGNVTLPLATVGGKRDPLRSSCLRLFLEMTAACENHLSKGVHSRAWPYSVAR